MSGGWSRSGRSAVVGGGLFLACAAASLFPDLFVLERSAVLAGEWWRLVTGHLVHHTLGHFLLDVGAGMCLLPLLRSRVAAWFLPFAVGLGVLLGRPDLTSYAGLSGVLHGAMVLVAADLARSASGRERVRFAGVIAVVVTKAILEVSIGGSLFTAPIDMGGETVYLAHLLGALAGLALLPFRYSRKGGTADRDREFTSRFAATSLQSTRSGNGEAPADFRPQPHAKPWSKSR